MRFDYELDAEAVSQLAEQNVIVEKQPDRTVVTFFHDVELTSTGKDADGKSMTVGKTPGRRVNIGALPDGRGVWLQTHLATWKTAKAPRTRGIDPADVKRMIDDATAAAVQAVLAATITVTKPVAPVAPVVPFLVPTKPDAPASAQPVRKRRLKI